MDNRNNHSEDGDPFVDQEQLIDEGSSDAPLISHPLRMLPLEYALVVFVLYMTTTAYIPFFTSPLSGPNVLLLIARNLDYAIAALLIVAFYRSFWLTLKLSSPILLLVGLALVSSTWSFAPRKSFGDAVVLLGLTLFGLYLGSRCTWHDLIGLVAVVTALTSLFSCIQIATPGLTGIDAGGNWSGVFIHKNQLGREMAIAIIVWLIAAYTRQFRPSLSLSLIALSSILLVGSRSITSLAVLLLAIVSLPVLRLTLSRAWSVAIALVLTSVFLVVVLPNLSELFTVSVESMGRDPTLTGRDKLWALVWQAIHQRPWLGYGYGGFWLGWEEGPSVSILRTTTFLTYHAHNGYLDLLLALGWIGLSCFVAILISGSLRVVRRLATEPDPGTLFATTFLVFFITYNLVETAMMSQLSWVWTLFVAVHTRLRIDEAWDRGRLAEIEDGTNTFSEYQR